MKKCTLKFWENFLENHYFLILVISFICLLLIKSYTSLFFSSPFNLGDEALYEMMARPFFYNEFPLFQSVYPIGYPFVLSIAYHFSSDKLVIYHLMLIINSILVTSIIFPLFFILRKYCDNIYSLIGAIVISCLPCVNVYSFMLISENLFIPLFYFALWALLESIDNDKKSWQISAGFSLVALFFIRIPGIAMALSLLLLFFILSVIEIKNKTFFTFLTKKMYLWLSGFFTFLLGLSFYYFNNLNLIGYHQGYSSVLVSNFSSIQGLVEISITFLNELEYIIISLYFLTILFIGIFFIIFIRTQESPKFTLKGEVDEKKIDEISRSLFSLKILLFFFFSVSVFTIIITITHMLGLEQIYNLPSNYSILGRYIDPIIPGIYLFGFIGLKQVLTAKNSNYSKITISLVILNIVIICIFAISKPFAHYNPSNIIPILYIEKILSTVPLIVFVLIGILLSSFVSIIIIRKEKYFYLLHIFVFLCILFSSYYAVNNELLQSKQAGQFSDIGRYFDNLTEKNVYILWDIGDDSDLQRIHFYLSQFWSKYPLIKFSAHDEISGEFKNRTKSADYLISTQSFDLPIVISSKSDYKLYQISSDPGQNQSLLLINRLSGNWYGLEREENGDFFRWIFTEAEMWIYSDADRNATLSFEARSFNDERYLVVHTPQFRSHQAYNISTQFSKVQYYINLKKGENYISLLSANKTNRSMDNSKNISMAIENVRIA